MLVTCCSGLLMQLARNWQCRVYCYMRILCRLLLAIWGQLVLSAPGATVASKGQLRCQSCCCCFAIRAVIEQQHPSTCTHFCHAVHCCVVRCVSHCCVVAFRLLQCVCPRSVMTGHARRACAALACAATQPWLTAQHAWTGLYLAGAG
jgi:hypothetical protein